MKECDRADEGERERGITVAAGVLALAVLSHGIDVSQRFTCSIYENHSYVAQICVQSTRVRTISLSALKASNWQTNET